MTWSIAYGVFVAGVIVCAAKLRKVSPAAPEADVVRIPDSKRETPDTPTISCWIGLAAVASALLLSVTNHMCQDTSVVPLLWVLPLALYLLTLMLCFEFERLYRRWLLPPLFGASAVSVIIVMFQGVGVPLVLQIGADAAVLFFGCMVCHGELAKSKPDSNHLTLFYLSVAAGGAIGGLSVAVLAPSIFNGYWEFHATLFASGVFFIVALIRDKTSFLQRRPFVIGTALGVAVLSLGGVLVERILESEEDVRYVTRNFYGVLRVIEDPVEDDLELLHGRISHGLQYEDSALSHIPTTYYTERSGIGLAIAHHPYRGQGLRIGVIGLGVGTIAAYAQKSDTICFYEINPSVVHLSDGPKPFFTYLKDCPGCVEVVLGDARLMLEDELRRGDPQRFDILAVDAFSSDAIPVHLLTKEALEIYRRHLRPPYGLIAFHISNRHFNLVPVVHALATQAHLQGTLIVVKRGEGQQFSSDWVLLGSSPKELSLEVMKEASTPWDSAGDKSIRLWTDDYSNLVSVLK
jgi:spermidine synthase